MNDNLPSPAHTALGHDFSKLLSGLGGQVADAGMRAGEGAANGAGLAASTASAAKKAAGVPGAGIDLKPPMSARAARPLRTRTQNPVAFTGEEWAVVRLAPALVVASATAGNSAKLRAAIAQANASVQKLAAAIRAECRLRLFSALAADCSGPHWPKLTALLNDDPSEEQLRVFQAAVIEQVQAAVVLVARKRLPAEAARYRKLIVDLARKLSRAPDEAALGVGPVPAGTSARAFVTQVRRATSTA